MALVIRKTNDASTQRRNTLLLGHSGSGKTTQAANYQRKYGKGLILSGEAGLISLSDQAIDFIPLTSFNGKHHPVDGLNSFVGICKEISSPAFKDLGYRWIMLDSLTELSDMIFVETEAEISRSGKNDGFKVYADYAKTMIGALKWFRDLPYEVICTSLVKEDTDADGRVAYLPLLRGQATQRQIAGLYDNVFALIKKEKRNPDGTSEVKRFIVTDEVHGYCCKYRSPSRPLKPIEDESDVTKLFDCLDGGGDGKNTAN